MPSFVSRRYQCSVCHRIALCVKAGEGEIRCCKRSMPMIDWDLMQNLALG